MRKLLGLELDPLAVPHELDGVAACLGDLHERVGARVAPTAYERGEVHAGLPDLLKAFGAWDTLEQMNAAMATRVYVADPDGTVGFRLVK